MRNGNEHKALKYLKFSLWVLILPMRNGNCICIMPSIASIYPRSYPTYEEWKLSVIITYRVSFMSSYPTYEEWKPSSIHI